MKIDDELDDVLTSVVESYLAARGEALDDISCHDLKALWEAINDEPKTSKASSWVRSACKFGAST